MDFEKRFELRSLVSETPEGSLWDGVDRQGGGAVMVVMVAPESPPAVRQAASQVFAELGSLKHANVVRVRWAGEYREGCPVGVMERLTGNTLAAQLNRASRPTVGQVVVWMASVLDGLSALHDRGVVHGDLEPGNIFLAEDGNAVVPKLVGFGVNRGRIRRGEQRPPRSTDRSALRSVTYASPRLVAGERPQPADDVYAVGAIVYEALTGALPYQAQTVVELREAVATGDAKPIQKVRPGIARALSEVVDRAMATEGARPHETAATMAQSLRAALAVSSTVGNVRARSGWRRFDSRAPGPRASKAPAGVWSQDDPRTKTLTFLNPDRAQDAAAAAPLTSPEETASPAPPAETPPAEPRPDDPPPAEPRPVEPPPALFPAEPETSTPEAPPAPVTASDRNEDVIDLPTGNSAPVPDPQPQEVVPAAETSAPNAVLARIKLKAARPDEVASATSPSSPETGASGTPSRKRRDSTLPFAVMEPPAPPPPTAAPAEGRGEEGPAEVEESEDRSLPAAPEQSADGPRTSEIPVAELLEEEGVDSVAAEVAPVASPPPLPAMESPTPKAPSPPPPPAVPEGKSTHDISPMPAAQVAPPPVANPLEPVVAARPRVPAEFRAPPTIRPPSAGLRRWWPVLPAVLAASLIVVWLAGRRAPASDPAEPPTTAVPEPRLVSRAPETSAEASPPTEPDTIAHGNVPRRVLLRDVPAGAQLRVNGRAQDLSTLRVVALDVEPGRAAQLEIRDAEGGIWKHTVTDTAEQDLRVTLQRPETKPEEANDPSAPEAEPAASRKPSRRARRAERRRRLRLARASRPRTTRRQTAARRTSIKRRLSSPAVRPSATASPPAKRTPPARPARPAVISDPGF